MDFNIKLGMTDEVFFKTNMDKLKNLPEHQKQKIANFWLEDKDHKITNEIELALLNGFTSKNDKVKMPQGNPYLFIRREYDHDPRYKNDYIDFYRSESPEYKNSELQIYHRTHAEQIWVSWLQDPVSSGIKMSTKETYMDTLIDGYRHHEPDGYADNRSIFKTTPHGPGIDPFELQKDDCDLDGSFEHNVSKDISLSEHINRMFNNK